MGGRSSPELSKNIRAKTLELRPQVWLLLVPLRGQVGNFLLGQVTAWLQVGLCAWVTGTAGKSLPGPDTEVREPSQAIMNPGEHSATAEARVGPSQAGCPRNVSKQ